MKRITFDELKALQADGKIKLLPITSTSHQQHIRLQTKTGVQEQTAENCVKKKTVTAHELEENLETKVVWTRSATLALLSAYEARDIEIDRTKKNKKFWQAIADELNASSLIFKQVTDDQARWKFASIKKSYNKKKDHNRESGNDPKSLDEFEERLSEILGDKKGVRDPVCSSFNSPLPDFVNTSQQQHENTNQSKENKDTNNIRSKISTSPEASDNVPYTINRKAAHGTGSRIAKTKIELEKQWLQHLKIMQEEKAEKKLLAENENKRKEEELQLKKEKFDLKRKKLRFEDLKLAKKNGKTQRKNEYRKREVQSSKKYSGPKKYFYKLECFID